MDKNSLILPVSIIAAAIIIASGFVFFLAGPQDSGQEGLVELPAYLEKSPSYVSEASLAGYDEGILMLAEDESGDSIRLISVSGTVTKTAGPEIAYISLSIETLDKSASKSQSDNAVLANEVMAALESLGIPSDDIETSSYNLREEWEWNDELRKSESIGYKTSNTIRVTVRDLDSVGSVVDAAVSAGANRVDSVSFALTKQTQSDLKTAALKEAAENAREKAQSIASGLGVNVGQVYSASESSVYSVPYYSRSYAVEAEDAAGMAPTPITPGDIEFSATVSVQFEIQ